MVDMCKRQLSIAKQKRRYKHIVIIDLAGFQYSLLSEKVRAILLPVFKVGGDNFPEVRGG